MGGISEAVGEVGGWRKGRLNPIPGMHGNPLKHFSGDYDRNDALSKMFGSGGQTAPAPLISLSADSASGEAASTTTMAAKARTGANHGAQVNSGLTQVIDPRRRG